MLLEYDGADFHGWQRQTRVRSVQGDVEDGLRLLCRQTVQVTAAGRTDAGVHALGQVGSFHLEDADAIEDPLAYAALLGHRLDRLLPHDVAVRAFGLAPDGFNARHDALRRSYRYRITSRRRPLERRQAWTVHHTLNHGAMRETIALIRKHRDFRAFTRTELDLPDYAVALDQLDLAATAWGIEIVVGARRFLHNFVRILVGTLIDVGRGRLTPTAVDRALQQRDRRQAGPTAPAQGLCLERVDYAVPLPWARSASAPSHHAPDPAPGGEGSE